MGYKQTEDVISDYFSELLGDASDGNDAIDKVTAKVGSNKNVSNLADDAKELGTQSLNDASHNPEVELGNTPPAKTMDPHSEVRSPLVESTDTPQVNEDESSLLKDIDPQSRHQAGTGVNLSQGAHTHSVTIPPKASGTISSVSNPERQVNDKSDLPVADTSSYEQHKQRLEKMLLNVNALESAQVTTTTQEASASTQEKVEAKLQVELEAGTTSQDLTQANYKPLPTLSSEWLENGRPIWAQEQFDILLIEVNGLQLAVPLVALGQIQPIGEGLTPLFGQSDWFMGLQKSPMGNVKTVNTAKFVMPERYQDDHDYQYVVSINGLNWGLAVDRIHQPISIDPDSIRWRVNRSSRPWMAGMVKDHMCVLLDIPSMGELLQQEDKNHPRTTGG